MDYVVHAAALKQVPILEYNPFEAVKTNVLGSQNVIDASLQAGVKKVIALSTDKAAAPVNLYGATKLTSDKLFTSANNYTGSAGTKFAIVRYGNVMGSRGSVIPKFKREKVEGVLPITDVRMTRFNITLRRGVEFVIDCFGGMRGGELFVPKLPSYRVVDVAKAIAPEARIEIVGIRPGEKIHEEMISSSDAANTFEFDDRYVVMASNSDLGRPYEFDGKSGQLCKDDFSYNSADNGLFLSVQNIRDLIKSEIPGS